MADEIIDDNIPQDDPLSKFQKYKVDNTISNSDPLAKFQKYKVDSEPVKKNKTSTIQSASPSLATSSTSLSEEKPKKDYDINQLLGKPESGIGVPTNSSESTKVVHPLKTEHLANVLPVMKDKAV